MLWLHGMVICFVLLFARLRPISGLEDAEHHGHRVERSGIQDLKRKQVLEVLENLPSYYLQAVELWQTLDQQSYVFPTTPEMRENNTDARLEALNNRGERIATDAQALKRDSIKQLDHKNNRKFVEDKLGKITLKMELVNKNFFTRFLEYTDRKKTGQEWYILKWATEVLDSNTGLAEPLITIKTNLLSGLVDVKSSYNNILDILAAPELVNELMCLRQKSAQQSIHVLYEQIILTEIKSYLMTLFAIEVVNKVYNQKRDPETIKMEFIDRLKEIHNNVIAAMNGTSREVWRCDQSFVEGQTYNLLPPIFQLYVLHESDAHDKMKNWVQALNPSLSKGCEKSCPGVTGSTMKMCKHKMCSHAESKKCTGILQNCELKHSEITVCSSDKSSYRRYEYITTGDGESFGVRTSCPTEEVTGSSVLVGLINSRCDYCLCTCDSSKNENISVFIDTRPVVTDIHQHKVLIGLRIVTGDTIHFEITEGKLLPSGHIDSSSLKPVQAPSRNRSFLENQDSLGNPTNFSRIRWDRKTICLDDLESTNENEVLTGVKFELTEDNQFQLAIRLTSFDFHTGELIEGSSHWKSHKDSPDAQHKSKLSMKYLDIPRGKDLNEPRSQPGQCFEFHTAGLKQDAGQTIVPFIDIQQITTDPPSPLSGAGLFLRGSNTSGGFLTPKLFTLNLASHMPRLK